MSNRWESGGAEGRGELDLSDIYKVETAEGYHMMGRYQDAADELAQIPADRQDDPRVLHVMCRVYWALRRIPDALACSDRYIQAAPHEPFGYAMKSRLLSYLDRPRENYELLTFAVRRFPDHSTMHYQLAEAAVECVLWPEARHWIYRVICMRPVFKQMALAAPAFAPIRTEIESMHPAN